MPTGSSIPSLPRQQPIKTTAPSRHLQKPYQQSNMMLPMKPANWFHCTANFLHIAAATTFKLPISQHWRFFQVKCEIIFINLTFLNASKRPNPTMLIKRIFDSLFQIPRRSCRPRSRSSRPQVASFPPISMNIHLNALMFLHHKSNVCHPTPFQVHPRLSRNLLLNYIL